MKIKHRFTAAFLGVIVLCAGVPAIADTVDLDKQLKYILDSKAIPLAVLEKCCDKDSISGYPGMNINYNTSLLDVSGLTWNVTATDLPSSMTPDSSVVGTGTICNCDKNEPADGTTTIDVSVTNTQIVETDVHVDVSTEVSIEGKDEILGTGVDVGLKMGIDLGVAVKEGTKISKDVGLSQEVSSSVPPNSMKPVNCSMNSFAFENKTFTMKMTLSGTVKLPTLDYAFKDGPSGHLPGFSFDIAKVLPNEGQRTVTSTGNHLTGTQFGVDVTCAVQEAKTMSDTDRQKCKCSD